MARRYLDSLFFAAENLTARLYYDDAFGPERVRELVLEYDSPPPLGVEPSSRVAAAGSILLGPFCEGPTQVTITATDGHPYAYLTVEQGHAACAQPVVVCDLQVSGTVSGTALTLVVTTSHGPWRSSLDGIVFTEAAGTLTFNPGASGTVIVRDQANCEARFPFFIPNPDNPRPTSALVDTFSFTGTDELPRTLSVFSDLEPPYALRAWDQQQGAPIALTPQERGLEEGAELATRLCVGLEGTTSLRFYALLTYPFARVEVEENSLLCGYKTPPPAGDFRFDYVHARPESVVGGDGLIQAAVLGASGPVLFSLDDYRTPGQSAGLFTDLFAGTYTVYARETLAPQRTITRVITVGAPTLGLRYLLCWPDRDGVRWRAELYLLGYTGPVETLRGTAQPLVLAWSARNASQHFFEQKIFSSEAVLTLLARAGDQLQELALTHERELRLDVVRAETLYWRGWVLPDLLEEPLLPRPYALTLTATDGLGTLSDSPFADPLGQPLRGDWSHFMLLRDLLTRLTLDLPWVVAHHLYPAGLPSTQGSEPLVLVSSDVTGFRESSGEPWSCGKVLQALLDYHGLRLQQREGAWHLERLAELSPDPLPARRYSPAGVLEQASTYPLLRVLTPPQPNAGPQPLYYQQARQLLSRLPAVASVRATATPGAARNYFEEPDFPADAFTNPTGPLLRWTGTLQHRRQANEQDATKPASLLLLRPDVLTDVLISSPLFTLPVGGVDLPNASPNFRCTLAFTVALAPGAPTFTPDPATGAAAFYVGLTLYTPPENRPLPRADGTGEDGRRTKVAVYELTSTSAVPVEIPFAAYLLDRRTAQVQVHFYGAQAGDILVSSPVLRVGSPTNGSFINESRGQTRAGRRLTRRDETLTLQLADTVNPDDEVFSVLARSVLSATDGVPLSLWREGPTDTGPAPAYYLLDLLVRDRLVWQQRACRVVRALLRGVCSPGALLVDPCLDPDMVLVLVSARYSVAAGTWDVTAVENLGLRPPRPVSLTGLLSEDGRLLLAENGTYILLPELV